jgi:hypothetical protein
MVSAEAKVGAAHGDIRPWYLSPLKRRGKNLPFLTRPRTEERSRLREIQQQYIRTQMA